MAGLRSIVVADADSASHEERMRGQGMHLVSRERVDASSSRYTWSPVPTAIGELGVAARVREVAVAPQTPASATSASPPAVAERAVSSSRNTELKQLADDLIAAYQETLRSARAADIETRAQVSHVVAESARHAGQQARMYRSEIVADRLKRFHDDLPDYLGKVFTIARDKAAELAKGQISTLATGGGLAALYAKAYAWWGVVAGGALGAFYGLATLGSELAKSGAGLHFIVGLVYFGCVYMANDAQKDLAQARTSSQPAEQLLNRSLDEAERRFFQSVGGTPPTRAALRASGPVQAGATAVFLGLAAAAVAAVAVGALLSVSSAGS